MNISAMAWNSPSIIIRPESSLAHLRENCFGVPSARTVDIRAVTVRSDGPYAFASIICVTGGKFLKVLCISSRFRKRS